MADTQKSTAAGNGGRLTSPDIDREIAALKDDMARISNHVSRLVSATGKHAKRSARYQAKRARDTVDSTLAQAGEFGDEAADAILEMRDTIANTVEESVQTRPFTTLALALGAGFIAGAMWRR